MKIIVVYSNFPKCFHIHDESAKDSKFFKQAFTYSNSTMATLEEGVKYAQS